MKSLRGIFLVLSILHFNLPLTSWARTPHSCYWSANKLAPDDYLPCYGSTTTAQYSCCQAGDKCLEGNACYDQDTGVTYQYGCTDPTFKDPHCPQKCNLDLEKSHWVGLIFCNGTNGLPNDSWVCHHPDNCGNRSSCASQVWGDTIQRQPPTGCENVKHGREYVALDAVGTIRDLVPLPAPTQTASWWLANSDRYQSVTSSTAISLPASTTLTTTYSPRSTGSSTSSGARSTSSAAETPDAAPSKPTASVRWDLCLGIPITVLVFFILVLLYMKREARKKRRVKESKHQETCPPHEQHAAHENNTKWRLWCMDKICLSKDALSRTPRETEQKHTAAGYEPKLELDSSPVVESPGSPAASELSASPVLQLRVVNGSCASPALSVQSRVVGVVDRLSVHDAGVAI